MKLLQMLMSLFTKHKSTAKKMMDEHGDKIDQITDKIPGDADDKMVQQVKDQLK